MLCLYKLIHNSIFTTQSRSSPRENLLNFTVNLVFTAYFILLIIYRIHTTATVYSIYVDWPALCPLLQTFNKLPTYRTAGLEIWSKFDNMTSYTNSVPKTGEATSIFWTLYDLIRLLLFLQFIHTGNSWCPHMTRPGRDTYSVGRARQYEGCCCEAREANTCVINLQILGLLGHECC